MQLLAEHNGVSTIDKNVSHQTHGFTKWCLRDKGISRLQYV